MGNKGSSPKSLIHKTDQALAILLRNLPDPPTAVINSSAAQSEAKSSPEATAVTSSPPPAAECKAAGEPLERAKSTVCECIELLCWAQRGKPISAAKKNEKPASKQDAVSVAALMTRGNTESNTHRFESDWIIRLLRSMWFLTVEAKKSLVELVAYLIREVADFRQYVMQTPDFVNILLGFVRDRNYDADGVCIHASKILHVAVREINSVAVFILNNHIWEFLQQHATVKSFDAQSLAFDIIYDCIISTEVLSDGVEQKSLREESADFINGLWEPALNPNPTEIDGVRRSNKFFTTLNELMRNRDILVVQNSMRLLQAVLFDPQKRTYQSMIQYVGDAQNLRIALYLLRDTSTKIQYEGFHMFRVFVLNPFQPDSVKIPLARNRDKIVAYLTDFQPEKAERNEQFQRERTMVIEKLKELGPPSMYGGSPQAPSPPQPSPSPQTTSDKDKVQDGQDPQVPAPSDAASSTEAPEVAEVSSSGASQKQTVEQKQRALMDRIEARRKDSTPSVSKRQFV